MSELDGTIAFLNFTALAFWAFMFLFVSLKCSAWMSKKEGLDEASLDRQKSDAKFSILERRIDQLQEEKLDIEP